MSGISPQPPSAYTISNYSNPAQRPDALAADPDIVLITPSSLPVDLMADLVLEDIGGTELITIIRHDQVQGQRTVYQPIKNVKDTYIDINPNTITGFSRTYAGIQSDFGIDINSAIGQIEAQSIGPIYMDDNGMIVVELDNLGDTDTIELAVAEPVTNSLVEFELGLDGGSTTSIPLGIVDGGSSLGYNVDRSTDGGNA